MQLGLEVGAPLRAGRAGAPGRPAAGRPRPKMSPSRSPRSSTRKVALNARPPAGPRRRRRGWPTGPRRRTSSYSLRLAGVAEHVVGGGDLLEALLGARVGVGVVLLGQLPVGARDLLVGRRVRHAEDLVVVLLEPLPLGRHGGSAPHLHHGRAQDLPLPAVAGAQHLDDLGLGRRRRPARGRRRRARSGRRRTSSGSMRSRPSRSSVSNSAVQICLTSSPPPWAMARSAVSSTGSSFSTSGVGGPLEMVGLLA